MASGNEIIAGIRANQKPHHDTLYCNENHKKSLVGTISGSGSLRADNLRISGLEVVTHERFTYPIVCQRGEVFDLVKDYKYGEAEPEEI